MARYTFARVPRDLPYIARSQVDAALHDTANGADRVLMLLADPAGAGVTRSTKNYILDEMPDRRFDGRRERLPVLLDLCDRGLACLTACELLAVLRNDIVTRINGAVGISRLGRHLAAFDSFYAIWTAETRRKRSAPKLVRTAVEKASVAVVKLTVSFAGLAAFHYAGDAAEAAGIFEDFGWATDGAIDMGRDKAIDGVFERTVDNIQEFVNQVIAPRLNGRLRDAIADRNARQREASSIMHDLLLDAISRIQRSLLKEANLVLYVDAIDLVEDGTLETVGVRFAIAGVADNSRQNGVGSVLGGRGPATRWRRAISTVTPETLGPLPADVVFQRLRATNLTPEEKNDLMRSVGAPAPVLAAALDDAYARFLADRKPRA